MKDKKIYIILVVSILVGVLGISYAYFSLNVIGNDTAKNNKIVTGNLELTFTDTSEITLNNMLPGDSVTKTIKVTNTGTKEVAYNVGWIDYINEITNNELIIEGTCKRLNSSNVEEGTCNNVSKKAITGSNVISNIQIEPNVTHEYTLTITFKETNKPQNYNKNKSFNGKLNITESTAKTVYCTFDGELTQGAEYVNGQYTYRYMQQGGYTSSSSLAWSNITTDGWGVQLTDKTSTDAVTSELCAYINDKPVVSMSYMFSKNKATTLDLSSFNTSNVTNMDSMFYSSKASTLDVSSFNTSNVTNMVSMFYSSKASTLDLSSFDTSKVTNMNGMFQNSQATTLDLSNFDTSNVTDMSGMFEESQATSINLSSFDTSKVTDMSEMFGASQATTLDLSNFNTSNVIDMNSMFFYSFADTLDLSSFDTSKVTNMYQMFWENLATAIDLSSFNTSNVTNMGSMFSESEAIIIKGLENFDTSKVTDMSYMFSCSKATTIDLSNFDTSNVTNMIYMFAGAQNLSKIYTSNKFNTDAVSADTDMFNNCTSLVGGAGTTYDSTKTDKTYARIDGGTSNPGYFTLKN